jgi:hypothetical protein
MPLSRLSPGEPLPPPVEKLPPEPFGQCDATASGAEDAIVRLARNLRVIELCRHHAREHELAMCAAGWVIIWDGRV